MQGLMQDVPLTLSMIFRRAEQLFGDKRIVTAEDGGTTGRAEPPMVRHLSLSFLATTGSPPWPI